MSGPRRYVGVAVGAILLVIAVGFCVATVARERERIDDAFADASIGWLALALVLAGLTMVSVALGWGRCLAALGERRPPRLVAQWFFVGELGKYVPGGIWPVVGRGELARQGGVGRVAAYRSVALSLAALYGAAMFPVAAVAAHPRLQRAAADLARTATKGRLDLDVLPWRRIVALIASYLPSWVLAAAVTAAVVQGYGADVGWRAPAASVLAWVCGFLAVPVPAGAGVREAVFIATSGLDPGLAVVVAVTARLAFVVVDLAGAAVSAPALGARRLEERRG